jgi:hypothetical protein
MLKKVFLSGKSWYNREADCLETDDPNLGFFSVTTKSSNLTQMNLELGEHTPACTEDLDNLIESLEGSPKKRKISMSERKFSPEKYKPQPKPKVVPPP